MERCYKVFKVLEKVELFTLFQAVRLSFFGCMVIWQVLPPIKNHAA